MGKLFNKIQKCIYLDLRYNKLDVKTVVQCIVYYLPELNYLFLKGNLESEPYVELLRNQEFTGLVDPWEP